MDLMTKRFGFECSWFSAQENSKNLLNVRNIRLGLDISKSRKGGIKSSFAHNVWFLSQVFHTVDES